MYAIVDIAGQQFRVEKNQKIYVHRLEGEAGSKVDFDKVLLIENDQSVTIGTPVIEGAMVYASIIDQKKSDKVLVFKKKRKKGYRKLNGHRQLITQILIEDIIEKEGKTRIIEKKAKPVKAEKVIEKVKVPEQKLKAPVIAAPETTAEKPEKKKTAAKKVEKKPQKVTPKTKASSKEVAVKKQTPAKKSVSVKKTAAAEKTTKASKSSVTKKPASKKSK